jgi:hypothetical protein
LVHRKYASSQSCAAGVPLAALWRIRKYTRNQHNAMLMLGNRMWKLIFAANWMRESRSVSTWPLSSGP